MRRKDGEGTEDGKGGEGRRSATNAEFILESLFFMYGNVNIINMYPSFFYTNNFFFFTNLQVKLTF